jgi:hypothetical protein
MKEEVGLYIISRALTSTEKLFYKTHPTVGHLDRQGSFLVLFK